MSTETTTPTEYTTNLGALRRILEQLKPELFGDDVRVTLRNEGDGRHMIELAGRIR